MSGPVNVYTQGFGSATIAQPISVASAPTTTTLGYKLGQILVVPTTGTAYILTAYTTTNGVVSATWENFVTSAGNIDTVTTQDTTVVVPTAGNINISGAGSTTTVGSGSTATVELTGLTNHAVLVGAGTTTITKLGVGATGTLLAGATAADPAFTASPSVTGSITAGTGLVATTGGITATGTSNINTSGAAVTFIGTGGTGATNIGNATGNTAVTGSLTASTTLTATLGNITATNGNVVLGTAGNKLISTSVASTTTAGANSFGTVGLSSGTATVSTSAVTASSIIILTRQAINGSTGFGELSIGTVMANTSFVVYAGTPGTPGTPLATDSSIVGWMIIN